MSDLPCKNPNCNSFGTPHPNCRCYAEGGEVFCSSPRSHKKGCSYYAEGGEAIDPDQVEVSPNPEVSEENAEEAQPEEIDPDQVAVGDEGGDDSNLNLSPEDLQKKMIGKYHPNGPSSYETPGQQLATVGEGIGKSFAGPVFTGAEELLGVDPKDITARAEANPGESLGAEIATTAGSLLTGTGEAALALKVAEKAAEFAKLGKIGSGVIKGAISTGILEGFDQASKSIMGQGNPEDSVNPIMAMGLSGFLGGAGGLAGGLFGKALEKGAEKGFKLGAKAEEVLAGVGLASQGHEVPEGSSKAFQYGYRYFHDIPKKIGTIAGTLSGTSTGHELIDAMIGNKLGDMFVRPITNWAGKYTAPAVVRWLSNGARGSLYHLIDYADKVQKGTSLINNSVDSLFKAGAVKGSGVANEKHLDMVKDWIDGGGMSSDIRDENVNQVQEPQGFAEGGKVKEDRPKSIHDSHDHLAQDMPEQNLLIQNAKGRISNYLSSMRPQQDAPKLAFDAKHDDREQNKKYDSALKIAVSPLSVMDHIQQGTLKPDHLNHLNSMYPELTGHLKQKVTERITKAQMEEEKPSYRVRQGLSMFLGAPLSSDMKPENMQAAQQVFQLNPKAHGTGNPQQSSGKHSKASLSKSDRAFMTDDQARTSRFQQDS